MLEQEIGGYKVLKALGAGGMASVYQAQAPDGREVALKFLHPQIANEPNARKRLQREAEAINRVSSSGVAKVFEVNIEGQTPYVAMELIKGITIAEDVSVNGTWDLPDLIDLAQWLARILRELHSAGVVHRDIKPANIMIAKQGPVLIDFGISQTTGAERLTATGLVTGTPGYISPQLIHGEDARPRDDWWSWLCVLLYCLSGRPPFGSGPIEVVLGRISAGQPDLSGVSVALQRIFYTGFQVDPELRASPEQLIAAFEAVNEGKDPDIYLPAVAVSSSAPSAGTEEAGSVGTSWYANQGDNQQGEEVHALPPSFPPGGKNSSVEDLSSVSGELRSQTRLYPPGLAVEAGAGEMQASNAGAYRMDDQVTPGIPGLLDRYANSAGSEVGGAPSPEWTPRYIPHKLPVAWMSCLLVMLSLSLVTGALAVKANPTSPSRSSAVAIVLMVLVLVSGVFGAGRARLRDAQLASGMLNPPHAALKAQPLLVPLMGVLVITVIVGAGVITFGQFGYQPLAELLSRILPPRLQDSPEVYRGIFYLVYAIWGTVVAFFSRSFRVGFASIVRILGGAGARFFWFLVALVASMGIEYLVAGGYW